MAGRQLLVDIDWGKYKTICAYEPIGRLNEVDVKPVLNRLQSQPDLKIHILGQSKDAEITTAKFDLVLVPVLAFDKDNYRLGWGGGFYDRFLANQPQTLKIGLCYQDGLVEQGLPHEPHDVPLDRIITEI